MLLFPENDGDPVERFAKEQQRQLRLKESLNGPGPVGDAFRGLCAAGCDSGWLEDQLIRLRLCPLRRSRKAIRPKDLRRVRRLIANLEKLSRELPGLYALIFLGPKVDWPIDPQDVPGLLSGFAACLRKSLEVGRKWQQLRELTAASQLPWLVEQVRACTGRPHYGELATLIGAAYDEPEFSEPQLKMFMARNKRKRRGNVSLPKKGL